MTRIYDAEGQTPEQVADGFLTFTARNAGERSQDSIRERFALFSEWTGAPLFPIEDMIEGQGDDQTFSTPFLHYCAAYGMSIDWVWLGDERSLVIGAYHAAKDENSSVQVGEQQ